MRLYELLTQLDYQVENGTTNIGIEHVSNDSREIRTGSLFVCIRGTISDGHQYIPEALNKGAAVIVMEAEAYPKYREMCRRARITVVTTGDTRYALASIAAVYYDHPANKVRVIGVTGTKGKTTTTYMIKAILEEAGYKVGLIGTIEIIIGNRTRPADHTTPESLLIQQYLAEMAASGCDFVVMEVSSQGLKMHRTACILFDTGVFTNLGEDHIGPHEHADQAEYAACKSLLFQQCRVGIGNCDDEGYQKVCGRAGCPMITYGRSEDADVRAGDTVLIKEPSYLGVAYEVCGADVFSVRVHIPGVFSVYNSLSAIAVCMQFDVPVEAIQRALKAVRVKGRIELLDAADEYTVMIDYAHNAMSLKSLLDTLRAYQPNRLIVLFGCGGNRAKARRWEMGETAGRLADLTIITSDNPRYEEPAVIMKDIESGMLKTDGKYVMIEERTEAMRYAIGQAQPNDIVIFAGKGHETYQEIRGVKHDMDERLMMEEIKQRPPALRSAEYIRR